MLPRRGAPLSHLQLLAPQRQRILGTPRAHPRGPGRGAFTTHAGAFGKMSRAIRASASSRVSRDRSASSSGTGRRRSPSVAHWPRRARPTQRSSVRPDLARRRVASGIVPCWSTTSRPACSRNFFVSCWHGTGAISPLQLSLCRVKASTFSR
jgi:hypothetical protein